MNSWVGPEPCLIFDISKVVDGKMYPLRKRFNVKVSVIEVQDHPESATDSKLLVYAVEKMVPSTTGAACNYINSPDVWGCIDPI